MASKKPQEDFVTYVSKGLQAGDPTIVGIAVAVAVVFLTILFLAVRGRRGKKGQCFLLMGICDSGKTLMFTRMVHKKFKQSVTSINVNSGSVTLPEVNKRVPVTDLPGHERLRAQMLDQHKAEAKGLIFVVDSGTVIKEIKEVAEYLYTILTDNVISQNAPPVLIACNKQDLTLCKGAPLIQKLLEKEMNTLRVTQSAALQDMAESSGNNNTFLGKRDKDFSFADIKPIRVDFVECSAHGKGENSDADLGPVLDWMATVV